MENTERKKRGERIKAVRLRLDLNQTDFGKRLGLKTSTISGYEAGDADPKPEVLHKIALLGGVSLDFLIAGHSGDLPPASTDQMKTVTGEIPSHAEAANEGINVHQGMMIASKVLSSKTGYAKALWENLKSFEAAVNKEIEVEDLKRDVREMKEMMKTMLNNQVAQGDGYEKKSKAQ